MAHVIQKAMGIGMIVMIIAFVFLPMAIVVTDDSISTTEVLTQDETVNITDGLNVTLGTFSSNDADVTVTFTETEEEATQTIENDTTVMYQFDADGVETVNVSVDDITTEDVTLTVEHDRTFGWGATSKLLFGQFDLIFPLVGFIVVSGLILVVIKR